MKLKLLSIALLLVITSVYAQEEPKQDEIQSEINVSIWKPFKKSYEARDWQTFNALHTDDILRVHDGGIQIGKEYKDAIKSYFESETEFKTRIDFVMERRTYKEDVGYEVGFYRVTYSKPGEEDRMSYGRFHVVLNKIDGQWKIIQDQDSNSFNGRPIGAEDFDETKILDLSD